MFSTVLNPDVKQKDADRAVVVAVASLAVFRCEDEDGDEVLRVGTAFPLLQALQRVNERLLQENPAESLLFDVVLVTTDAEQQRLGARLITSARRHGLEVGSFCFPGEEDFLECLQKINAQLFLTTDKEEASSASQRGILSALLDQRTASCPSDQLRVLLCGDSVVRPEISPKQSFSAQLGEMRRRFGLFDSPLALALVTSRGGGESCGAALRMLRSRGVAVDEAFSLAGAPLGPVLSALRPHFLLSDHPEE